ncbi:thermonuclease family protein [Consotaella aegiceratis]|uniref:thermonuclease family protein n=1 Tax=Consotaella aegiceratis TaxID=3097961 RepID=UPI002F415282
MSPDSQPLERIEPMEDPYPLKLRIPPGVKAITGTSFSFDDQIYRLGGVSPIAQRRVCQSARGRRWSCGIQSRLALRSIIVDHVIECKEAAKDERDVLIVECRANLRDIAEQQVQHGHAFNASGGPYEAAESAARAMQQGVWADPECFLALEKAAQICGPQDN